MSNPELTAAWAAVPELVHIEKQRAKVAARQEALGDVMSPDQARRAVIDDAIRRVMGGEDWPDDVDERAAQAYTDALMPQSEYLALREAANSLKNHADFLRASHAETALEALGVRLSELMDEVKPLAADLNGANSAEAAIQAGGKAPEAWRTLTSMVGTLRNIRDAQYEILRPTAEEARWAELLRSGHGEVAGLNPDDVPERILESMRTRRYDVNYLVYLSRLGTAYVPTSYEELDSEAVAPEYGIPDGPVIDISPRVVPIPKPPEPKRHGHEFTPDLRLR